MVSPELALAAVGAGLAAGAAGVGSGIGQGIAAAAGAGAIAEDEATFGKALVFSVLPETQAIYGLLVAILIVFSAGILGGGKSISLGTALVALGAGLAVGLAGLSGIGQGIAAAAGIGAMVKDETIFGKAIVYSVLPETQAIYGLLVAIILMVFGGILGGKSPSIGVGLAAVGAGLAVGLAGTSGIGQGIAAASSVEGLALNEELFGKLIVLSVLPETQAIYGLLIAIIIAANLGIMMGSASLGAGLAALGAGFAVGIAGMSGVGQGIAAASGARSLVEDEAAFGKSIVFSVLPETQAIYGLLVAIIAVMMLGSNINLATGLVALGAGLAVGIAGTSGIGQGIAAASGIAGMLRKDVFGKLIVYSVLPETQAIYGLLLAILALFVVGKSATLALGLAALGAGLAVGFGGTSGIGQGIAAASGIRAMVENERIFAKTLILSILPETRAIYGLLVGILCIMTLKAGVGLGVGLAAVGAGLAVGLVGVSGIGQGFAAASGSASLVKREEVFSRALVFSVLPETQAIYGLLTAILIMIFLGILGGSASTTAGLAALGAGLAVGLAGSSAIGQGVAAASGVRTYAESPETFGKSLVMSILPETQSIYGLLVAIMTVVAASSLKGADLGAAFAAIGAGLAVGIAGFSGIGQGIAAASGAGALIKDPASFSRSLILSILPETRSIYGLLIAIMVMVLTGLLGGSFHGTVGVGLAAMGAGLAVGLAGLSGIGQGITSAVGIENFVKDPGTFGRSLLFAVFPETQAIYGLLVAILIMMFCGILGGSPSMAMGLAAVGAGIAVGFAGTSGIGQGIAAAGGSKATFESPEAFGRSVVFSILPETQSIYGLLAAILVLLPAMMGSKSLAAAAGLIGIGVGLAVGVAGVSGVGQGIAAAGGSGALIERAETFAKSLILSIFPETRAIYGLLIAIMALASTGLLGGGAGPKAPAVAGLATIGAGAAVGLAGFSGVGQGITSARGAASTTKREEVFSRALVFSVLPETQAIYGLLTAILVLFGLVMI